MKLNGQQIFDYMANLPDELILESLPPVVGTGRFGRSARSESRVKAFFQSGWFAAVLCAVVSLGVVGAVMLICLVILGILISRIKIAQALKLGED